MLKEIQNKTIIGRKFIMITQHSYYDRLCKNNLHNKTIITKNTKLIVSDGDKPVNGYLKNKANNADKNFISFEKELIARYLCSQFS